MSGTTLDAALAWAARGFRVFPLRPGSKKPAPGWDGWPTRATSDPAAIRRAWAGGFTPYNIGVLTDEHVVVDVDDKNGKGGSASFDALGLDYDTLVVLTPSGGKHAYHSGPNCANSAGKLASGIDIRSFHGYVVAPGSWLDPEDPENKGVGGFYSLLNDAPVKRAPDHLLARLEAPRARQDAAPLAELDTDEAVALAAAWLATDAKVSIENAAGDDTAFKVAARAKDFGLSADVVLDLMLEHWNERCSPPWAPDELAIKVGNAFSYGTSAPGVSSPELMLAGVDIEPPRYRTAPAAPWFRHGDDWQSKVAWLYHETLPRTGLAFLVAPSQSGKTFLALHLAHSLALGRPFFGVQPEERGGTALLLGEGTGGIGKRMAALGSEDRLPIYATRIGVLAATGALAALETTINAMAADMLAEHGVPLRLLVLDTLSSSGVLADENDNAQAALALRALEAISERVGALMVITHHPTKSGGAERGAGALRGNAEVFMEIQREAKAHLRYLEITKAREAETRTLGSFTLETVVLGEDARGRKVKSCIVKPGLTGVRTAPAPHTDEFLQALQFAMVDFGERIGGKECVELMHVEHRFRQDFKGAKRTSKACTEAFEIARAWAEGNGLVTVVTEGDRAYYAPLSVALAA